MHSGGEHGGTAGIHCVHSIEGQRQVQQHSNDGANTEAIAQDQNDGIPAQQSVSQSVSNHEHLQPGSGLSRIHASPAVPILFLVMRGFVLCAASRTSRSCVQCMHGTQLAVMVDTSVNTRPCVKMVRSQPRCCAQQ